jgi:putative peptidoglycan lipid II flippase
MLSEEQTTMSSASFISAAAFGGAIVGFFLQQVVAFYFGASTETDAFFMAQGTSELLSKLLLGGSVTAVFLPFFVERITRGQREEAWHLGLNVLHIMAALFVVLITLLAVFTRPFVAFIAPGFDEAATALTVSILRLLLPSFLFLFLVDMATAMLHSLKHFTMPALLRLVAPLTSIVSILLFVHSLGIYSLALGVVAGSVLQLLLLFATLHRKGFRYRFVFAPADPAIRRLLYYVYPFILSVLVTQGAGIVYRILVSDLTTGSLSALKFAEKITQLLAIMFLSSITFVIFPVLSEKAAKRDFSGMRDTIASAIRLITFITLPLIAGVIILRDPLIALIYQYGKFTPEGAAMTSIALLWLVLGLTINGISSVLGHATLALQETRAAVAVTIASQAVAIALFVVLVPIMGHAGLALGSSLVPLSITLLYFLYLTRFIKNLSSIFIHRTFVKTGILTAIMAVAVVATAQAAESLVGPSTLSRFVTVLLPTLVGVAVFAAGARLWNIPEMMDVIAILKQKKAKWSKKKLLG